MACDHCEELREEIAFLRRELGIQRVADLESRLCIVLGITKTEAAVLSLLYSRRGAVMSKGAIWDVLYASGDSEPELKIVDVYICKLRRRLVEDAIATVWSRGYTLTASGLAQVEQALAMAPDVIVKAEPLQCRTPSARASGGGAVVPLLRRLRAGDCNTVTLRGVVAPERQYQVSSILGKMFRDGRVRRVEHNGRGRLNVWGITAAGRQYLAEWEGSRMPEIAA